MHLTNTNYKKYYPLEALSSEGVLGKITIVSMGELDALIEEIQWHFDEVISIEALVGDYIGAYNELYGAVASTDSRDLIALIIEFVSEDYDNAGLFVNLTSEHRLSVLKTVSEIFEAIDVILTDNEVNMTDEPPWELIGMRGTTHVILGQAKPPQDLKRAIAASTE